MIFFAVKALPPLFFTLLSALVDSPDKMSPVDSAYWCFFSPSKVPLFRYLLPVT